MAGSRAVDHSAAAQRRDAAPAEPAGEIAFGFGGVFAVAADLPVEVFADQQALVGVGPRSERAAQQRQRLDPERPRHAKAGAEHGGLAAGAAVQFGLRHEAPGFIDPGDVGHDAGPQEQQPWRARRRRRRFEPGAARSRRYQQLAAGGIGNSRRRIARAGVGDEHLAHQSG